jgi:lysophospholipase L1-like esterase
MIPPLAPRLRRSLAALAAVAALALAAGCSSGGGGSTGPEEPVTDFGTNNPNVIVGLGDSITFGIFDTGVDSCDERYRATAGYTPRLSGLTGKTVVNEGVCGEHSGEGAARVRSVLAHWKPAVLLIDYSPNDIFYGTDVVIGNLRRMIAAARQNKTVPVVGTLTPALGEHEAWEPFIETLNAHIRALCAEESVECADHWQAFIGSPAFGADPYALLSDDGLHPNGTGYTVMARTWRWPVLRVY